MIKGSTYPLFSWQQKMMGVLIDFKSENIEHIHFKMHGLKEIVKMVEKNCFMVSLDIKHVYYSIRVDESSQK